MGALPSRGGSGGLSMEEVQRHATRGDAWMVLFGEAIDVTAFIPLHPGGEEMMVAYLGKDATADWQTIHTPDAMDKYAEHLTKMGRIRSSGGLLDWVFARMSKPGGRYAAAGGGFSPDRGSAPEAARQAMSASAPAAAAGGAGGADAEPAHAEPVRWTAEHEAELPPGAVFDVHELARWDGVQLPMCIGICGLVIDVSSSPNFVPDFGYGKLWAGMDTTWAMATVSLKVHDANRFDFELGDLSEQQFAALAGWYKHFSEKYRQVGTLRELRDRDFSSVEAAARALPQAGLSVPG